MAPAASQPSNMPDQYGTLVSRINATYRERNACVSLIAKMAHKQGLKVGILHDETALAFHNVVYIDLPSGQISWHIADEDMDYFEGLPVYEGHWDGHDTPTKYERVKNPKLT